jgi:hypothetical protein
MIGVNIFMKKLYTFIVSFFLLGLFNTPVSAENVITDPVVVVPTQTQRYANTKRLEIKERIAEVKASRSATLAQKRKQNIEAYWERLTKRLLNLIERQEGIIDRMNSRVKTIEEEDGEDLSDVKVGLKEAQTKLDLAKANLSAADESFEDVLESENPKEAFKAVRDTVYEIRKTIIEVHTSLAQMIGQIRGLRGGE